MAVTAASGRTGIAAGCVPEGGMLISLEKMTSLAVEPPEELRIAELFRGELPVVVAVEAAESFRDGIR
jgi:hypothetical protein